MVECCVEGENNLTFTLSLTRHLQLTVVQKCHQQASSKVNAVKSVYRWPLLLVPVVLC